MQHDRFSVATVFGPVSYLPCPLLVFKRVDITPHVMGGHGGPASMSTDSESRLKLVATGSLQNVNPDRIVLKKVLNLSLAVMVGTYVCYRWAM